MNIPSFGVALFERDPLLHIDMSQALARKTGRLVSCADDRALVYLPDEAMYFLSATSEAAVLALAGEMNEPWDMVVLHQRFAPDAIRSMFRLGDVVSFCANVAYLGPRLPVPDVCEIRTLDESAIDFVSSLYHLTDRAYCLKTLREKKMLGAFVDGKLVGFIGIHSEGSIGMLEVLPAYRRRGIGMALESAMLNRFLAEGLIPYGQIFETNAGSFALQDALQLVRSVPDVCWMERI